MGFQAETDNRELTALLVDIISRRLDDEIEEYLRANPDQRGSTTHPENIAQALKDLTHVISGLHAQKSIQAKREKNDLVATIAIVASSDWLAMDNRREHLRMILGESPTDHLQARLDGLLVTVKEEDFKIIAQGDCKEEQH